MQCTTHIKISIIAIFVSILLAGCGGEGAGSLADSKSPGALGVQNVDQPATISGVVYGSPDQLAKAHQSTFLSRIIGVILPSSYANVTGLAPLGGVVVELVRLDDAGLAGPVIGSATSDPITGNYNISTTLIPANAASLMVRVQGQSMRAFVTRNNNVDITPVTEVVAAEMLSRLPAVPLTNFSLAEVDAMVDLLSKMNLPLGVDFATDQATVQTAAGTTLVELATGYARSAVRPKINSMYESAKLGEQYFDYTTWWNGGLSIESVQMDPFIGIFAYSSVDGATSITKGQLGEGHTVHRMNHSIGDAPGGRGGSAWTLINYIFDESSVVPPLVRAGTATPSPNGQLVVTHTTQGGAGVGFYTPDKELIAYPVKQTNHEDYIDPADGITVLPGAIEELRALVIGSSWLKDTLTGMGAEVPRLHGSGGGFNNIVIDDLAGDTTAAQEARMNFPTATGGPGGNWNLVEYDSFSGTEFVAAQTGTLSVNFDYIPLSDPAPYDCGSGDTLKTWGFIDTVPTPSAPFPMEQMYLNLAVGGLTGTITKSTVNNIGMGGSGELAHQNNEGFYYLMHVDGTLQVMTKNAANCDFWGEGGITADGQVAFFATGPAFNDGAQETRGMTVLGRQTTTLSNAAVSGTYNVISHGNYGDAVDGDTTRSTMKIESRYGTLTFNGAGVVTAGDLYKSSGTMNLESMVNGVGVGVANGYENESVDTLATNTYAVSTTDAKMTLTITLTSGKVLSGQGFVTKGGDFIAFVAQSDETTNSGERSIFILARQS